MSGGISGATIDLSAVRGEAAESGVALGRELLDFSEAVMANDLDAMPRARVALQAKLGPEGVVDTAAVIAMFNIVDRVADATGIPIDPGDARDFRYGVGSELGMDHLSPEARDR